MTPCACLRRRADRHRPAGGDRRSALGAAQQSRGRRRTSPRCSPPGARRVCRSSISATIRSSPASPYAPHAPGHRFKPCAAPRDGETVIGKNANSAFVGAGLEGLLDELGATTLVLCGVADAEFGGGDRAARRQPRLSGLCRRRRLLGGRQGRSQRQALAGGGRACAVARPSPGRICAASSTPRPTLRAAATAKARQRRAAGKA